MNNSLKNSEFFVKEKYTIFAAGETKAAEFERFEFVRIEYEKCDFFFKSKQNLTNIWENSR